MPPLKCKLTPRPQAGGCAACWRFPCNEHLCCGRFASPEVVPWELRREWVVAGAVLVQAATTPQAKGGKRRADASDHICDAIIVGAQFLPCVVSGAMPEVCRLQPANPLGLARHTCLTAKMTIA